MMVNNHANKMANLFSRINMKHFSQKREDLENPKYFILLNKLIIDNFK